MKSPHSKNQIVPAFDSAKQISREDQLEMRIFFIVDDDQRRNLDERFRDLKDQKPHNHPVMTKAENDYVDRHLKPEPDLKLEMLDSGVSYEQRVEELKRDFRDTQDADTLRRNLAVEIDLQWTRLERDTETTLAREKEHVIRRDEFFKDRNGITSHQFNREVRRDR